MPTMLTARRWNAFYCNGAFFARFNHVKGRSYTFTIFNNNGSIVVIQLLMRKALPMRYPLI
jgi:hypothetical protein